MDLEKLKGVNYTINEDGNVVIEGHVFDANRKWGGDEKTKYEKWKSSFKRNFGLKALKIFNKSVFEKLTMEQRQALIIFDKTIAYNEAIPTQMPDGSKVLVEYAPKDVLIVADYRNGRIKITNHIFQYIIDMNEKMANHIDKSYRKRAECVRMKLESKYDANVQNSLKNVIKNIKK